MKNGITTISQIKNNSLSPCLKKSLRLATIAGLTSTLLTGYI